MGHQKVLWWGPPSLVAMPRWMNLEYWNVRSHNLHQPVRVKRRGGFDKHQTAVPPLIDNFSSIAFLEPTSSSGS